MQWIIRSCQAEALKLGDTFEKERMEAVTQNWITIGMKKRAGKLMKAIT